MSITRTHFAARFNLSGLLFCLNAICLSHYPISKHFYSCPAFLTHMSTVCVILSNLSAMLLNQFLALFIFFTSIFSLSFFVTSVSNSEYFRLCLLHFRAVPITFVLSIYSPFSLVLFNL